jgi:hypothetical protein
MNITVNGKPRKTDKKSLSYADIVEMAFPNSNLSDPATIAKGRIVTITVHSSVWDGSMIPGESVSVFEGMDFTVSNTSRA